MTREQAIALLNCYACGDLAPDVQRQLDAVVAGDPELAALARQLREQNERVGQVIVLATVPDALRHGHASLEEPPPVDIEPRPRRTGGASLLAAGLAFAAAALLAVALVWGLAPTPTDAGLVAAAGSHHAALLGALVTVDPAAPDAGFEAAGVPDVVRMVPDLSHLGLTVQDVHVLPGEPPGVGVAYTDGTRVYLCQMWVSLAVSAHPAATRDVGGVLLQGFREGDVSLVVWSDGAFVCVMSASVPLPDLIALVERRLTASG